MIIRPADAEQLDCGSFLQKTIEVSKYAPPAWAVTWHIVCPRCSTKHPSTGKAFTCGGVLGQASEHRQCKLSMQMEDGKFFIWLSKEQAP
jgi:hypothetical protein